MTDDLLECRIFKVTAIIPRRQNKWLEVVISGAEPLRLPAESAPAWLHSGVELDAAAHRELSRLSAQSLLMARALCMLERREHFEAELKRKLFSPGQDDNLPAAVLARCRELGYLDDGRALKMALDFFAERGGIGPMRLRQLLFERGCPPGLVDKAIVEFSEHFDEGAETRALLAKRRRHFELRLEQLRRRLLARRAKAQAVSTASKVEEQVPAETEPAPEELDRRDLAALRQQLAASVLAFLQLRGLGGDSGRRQAKTLVDELLSGLGNAGKE